MNEQKPSVSIGLPVFNGERYLKEAIESLLSQTFTDLELIICDNASEDATQEICTFYAEKDQRVRYHRNEINVGAAKNYNRVFELSSGKYFKWAAHDDMCAPEYIEKCVAVLDAQPSVVICHTNTIYIDANGDEYDSFDDRLDLRSPKPYERYHKYFVRPYKRCNAVFGLMRTDILKKTSLIGAYHASDQVLLGQLALYGIIYRIPEPLFYRRDHPEQIYRKDRSRRAMEAWFEPKRRHKITFPQWRLLTEHCKSIFRTPMNWKEKLLCLKSLGYWVRQNDGKLIRNLFLMEK